MIEGMNRNSTAVFITLLRSILYFEENVDAFISQQCCSIITTNDNIIIGYQAVEKHGF